MRYSLSFRRVQPRLLPLVAHLLGLGLFERVKQTRDDPRPPGTPRLLLHQHVKPSGAGAGDRRARRVFPGHFMPAPFFNEGCPLEGT
jgi:hypothetical protein